jgi:sugar lactone lactonase YvrE
MKTPLQKLPAGTTVAVCIICTAAFLSSPAAVRAAEPCGPGEICALKNPEDMIRLEGSRWAVVSRLGRDPEAPGGFSVVDLEAQTSRVLTPDVSKPAVAMYSDCPGAPVAADLITHGLDVRRSARGESEVFAVNHGGRESIEVFDLHVDDQGVRLTWKGCVMIPAEISANAVAALPDGLAVSSFGTSGDQGTAELLAGTPGGFVGRWTPKQGWTHVAGSEFGGDNGVTSAPDGSALYVNDWNDGTLRIVPLAQAVAPATIKLGKFHPDNVHFLPDGNLLIAGQIGSARDILACAAQSTCSVASMIVVVDPKAQVVRLHWTVAPTLAFGAASSALLCRNVYWMSSFRGDRIVRLTNQTH